MVPPKFLFVCLLVSSFFAKGQNGNCAIRVFVSDKSIKNPVTDTVVISLNDSREVLKFLPNADGEFYIKKLNPGKYSITVVARNYKAARFKKVIVGEGRALTCLFHWNGLMQIQKVLDSVL